MAEDTIVDQNGAMAKWVRDFVQTRRIMDPREFPRQHAFCAGSKFDEKVCFKKAGYDGFIHGQEGNCSGDRE